MTRSTSRPMKRFHSSFLDVGKRKVVQTPTLKLEFWLCFFLIMWSKTDCLMSLLSYQSHIEQEQTNREDSSFSHPSDTSTELPLGENRQPPWNLNFRRVQANYLHILMKMKSANKITLLNHHLLSFSPPRTLGKSGFSFCQGMGGKALIFPITKTIIGEGPLKLM